ncbi:MAG TPA: helix-turn-helix domain-containing protein [Solirubrobacteraceae bacterium]|nr:helix-turn-helix domain-containing protein [Solirubrobacteraceae bacterium]
MTAIENIRSLRSDARRNREAVLAAAKELFAKEGLEAQMPDVARAANVGVGTVYRHFPSKDELVTALVVAHFETLADKARECLAMDDPWDGISEFIRSSAHAQAQDRCLCDVTTDRAEMVAGVAIAVGMPELVDQLVKRAQRAGKLRRDLTWEDIPTIVCGLGTTTQQLAGPGIGRWPRLVEIIIDGLRAPGSAKLPPPL